MSEIRPRRVNILLGEEHAAKLLDQADPDEATITALLDAVPGAFERAQQGLADVRAGRVVALDDL